MGAYPNVNKVLKILYIDSQKMRLEDMSKWKFLSIMTPPSSWKGGDSPDTVSVEEFPSTKLKSESLYAIRGVSQKDTNTQAEYLGGAEGEPADINVTKSMIDEKYPENFLDKPLIVRRATGNLIVLEDDSVWSLAAPMIHQNDLDQMNDWHKGQVVIISRTTGKGRDIRVYSVTNEETGVILLGEFKGWER